MELQISSNKNNIVYTEEEIMLPYKNIVKKAAIITQLIPYKACYDEKHNALEIIAFYTNEIIIGNDYKAISITNEIANKMLKNNIKLIIKGKPTIYVNLATIIDLLEQEKIIIVDKGSLSNILLQNIIEIEKIYTKLEIHPSVLNNTNKILKILKNNFDNYKIDILIQSLSLLTEAYMDDLVYDSDELHNILDKLKEIIR